MNVGNHFKKRYCQRLLGIPETEINAYVRENAEYLNEQCLSLFNSSEWIWSGSINGNDVSHFYVAGTTVLVVNESNTNLVTVWNSDFGFSEKINKKIAVDIINDIKRLSQKEEKAYQKISTEVTRLELESDNTKALIDLLNGQIQKLEGKISSIEKQISILQDKPLLIKAEVDSNAIKLLSSLDYKLDMMRISKQSA